jgi:hypothetical protein
MEFDPHNDEVIKLLTKLKASSNGAYPPELLAARKAHYMQQVTQVGIAAGTGLGIKEILSGGNGPGIPPAMGTLLQAVLVVAVVAEASVLGYIYRDKLAELLNISSGNPKVEESLNPPAVTSPIPQIQSTASPIVTETQTPIGTSSPIIVINGTTIAATEVVSPANSIDPLPADKNGNQYGLTPKPERTKDPNDGSSDNGAINNDSNNNKDSNKNKP